MKKIDITVNTEENLHYTIFTANTNDLKIIQLFITIFQNGIPYDLTGSTVRIAIKKPDRKTVFQDCEVIDALSGKCEVVLNSQANIVAGEHQAEVMVYKGESVAVTGKFSYRTEKGILDNTTVESTNEWQSINKAISDAEGILIDLRENGTGVDAQARADLVTVNAELAKKANDSEVRKISQSITMADLSTEVKEGMTGGSVAVVAENVVGRENVKQKAIDDRKIIDANPVRNLFNPDTINIGHYINPNTGEVVEGDIPGAEGVSQVVSDFIPVNPTSKYSANFTAWMAYYDSNFVFVSGSNTQSFPITPPSNASYMRVTVRLERVNIYQIEEGLSVTPYKSYKYSLKRLSVDNENLLEDSVESKHIKNISQATGKNLFDKSKATSGQYISNNTGNVIIGSPNEYVYFTSDYIEVEGGESYVATHGAFSAAYDENYVFLQGFVSGNNPYPMPTGAKYFRTSIREDNIEIFQLEKGTVSTAYEAFHLYDKLNGVKIDYTDIMNTPSTSGYWTGKTFNIIGDSITYGLINTTTGEVSTSGRFPTLVAQNLGMKVNNYGISSSTIAVNPNQPTQRNPMVERFVNMDNNADLIIVAGSTNDWQYDWSPLGDMTSRENTTFYGALHNLCLGLLEKYPKKHLLFITPIKRSQGSYSDPYAVNANGKTLKEYGDIIKEVCGYYGIPVLDGYNEITINPHVPTQKTLLVPDGTHPNVDGHLVYSKRVTGYLKQLA